MKAAVRSRYGDAGTIDVATVDDPVPGPEDVLVRVHAVSLNASDWEFLTGSPGYIRMWGLFKPRHSILGSDIAGTVVSMGSGAKRFQAGDEVFGDVLGHFGGLAEYASLPEKCLSRKPRALGMIEAATLPQAGLVALQGLRDKGHLKSGERVLINGAGGGSGSFAVQLAHAWGAHVTGVDRGEKLELIRRLGAEVALDFTREDFTSQGVRYDLILDLAAHHSLFDIQRALTPKGRYVMVGGSVSHILGCLTLGPLLSMRGRKMGLAVIEANKYLDQLVELVENKTISPVIDRVYPLDQAREALGHLGAGAARGKIVVAVL
jgi:NADPH:quinone reductase-like Zn-dependent oxidoreductase